MRAIAILLAAGALLAAMTGAHAAAPAPSMRPVSAAVGRAAAHFPGTPSILVIDLRQGARCGVNTRTAVPAASLIKLPILAALYDAAAAGALSLSQTVTLRDQDKVGGGGVIQTMKAGTRLTLDQLAEHMIAESDNTAADLLIGVIGMDRVNRVAQAQGWTATRLVTTLRQARLAPADRNTVSARDLGVLLVDVWRGRLVSAEASARMLALLRRQQRNQLIPAGLPVGTVVAHKTGQLAGLLHDAGIVEAPGHPYVLICLGRGIQDQAAAQQAWVALSKAVYAAMTASP